MVGLRFSVMISLCALPVKFDDGQFLEGRKPLYLKYAVIIEPQGNFHHRYFFTDLAQTRIVKAVEKWRCSHET